MQTAMESSLITTMEVIFDRELPGFVGAKHFKIEPIGDEAGAVFAKMMCLDAVRLLGEKPVVNLSLLVVAPGFIWRDYQLVIDQNMVDELEIASAGEVLVLAVVHPRDPLSTSTANLYSPIVVNRRTGRAEQIIPTLGESEIGWSIRTPFPPDEES